MFAYFPIKIVIWDHLGVIILHFLTHLGVFELGYPNINCPICPIHMTSFGPPFSETMPKPRRCRRCPKWIGALRMFSGYALPQAPEMALGCWDGHIVCPCLTCLFCVGNTCWCWCCCLLWIAPCHPSNSFLWIPVGWNLCDRQPSEYASLVLAVVFSFREEGSCCSGTNKPMGEIIISIVWDVFGMMLIPGHCLPDSCWTHQKQCDNVCPSWSYFHFLNI